MLGATVPTCGHYWCGRCWARMLDNDRENGHSIAHPDDRCSLCQGSGFDKDDASWCDSSVGSGSSVGSVVDVRHEREKEEDRAALNEEIRELKLKIEAMEKEMAKPKQKKPVQLAQQAIMSCPACCLFVRHFPVDKRHGDFWVVVNGQPGSPPVVDATEYESFGKVCGLASWRDSNDFKTMRQHVMKCLAAAGKEDLDGGSKYDFYRSLDVLKKEGVANPDGSRRRLAGYDLQKKEMNNKKRRQRQAALKFKRLKEALRDLPGCPNRDETRKKQRTLPDQDPTKSITP